MDAGDTGKMGGLPLSSKRLLACSQFTILDKVALEEKNKMQRWNKEWIVASADEWAKESGLSQGEYKNQALPILKKLGIIDVKTWKLKGTRKTWIHLNVDALDNTYDTFFEFYEMRREDNFHDDTILGSNNHNTYAKIRKKPPKKKK